jgi:hypothetical protein
MARRERPDAPAVGPRARGPAACPGTKERTSRRLTIRDNVVMIQTMKPIIPASLIAPGEFEPEPCGVCGSRDCCGCDDGSLDGPETLDALDQGCEVRGCQEPATEVVDRDRLCRGCARLARRALASDPSWDSMGRRIHWNEETNDEVQLSFIG